MEIPLGEIVSNVASGAFSAIAAWLARSLWNLRKDVDAAHAKIRALHCKLDGRDYGSDTCEDRDSSDDEAPE